MLPRVNTSRLEEVWRIRYAAPSELNLAQAQNPIRPAFRTAPDHDRPVQTSRFWMLAMDDGDWKSRRREWTTILDQTERLRKRRIVTRPASPMPMRATVAGSGTACSSLNEADPVTVAPVVANTLAMLVTPIPL